MEEIKRQALQSSNLKCGKRTFFFDIYLASNSKKYLKVTESRVPEAEGEKGKRNSFILFESEIPSFQEKIQEVAGFINQ